MSKPELKVLSFPEFQKKAARKARWKQLVDFVKAVFRRKVGFEKYKLLKWGHYTNNGRTYVIVQNLATGKTSEHEVGGHGSNLDYDAVKYFVSKLK